MWCASEISTWRASGMSMAMLVAAGLLGAPLPLAAQQPAQTPPPAANPGKPAPETPASKTPAPEAQPSGSHTPPGPNDGTQPDESAAQSPDVDPDMQRVAACKAEALKKLKQRSPSVDDIHIDIDGLTIAQADAKLGDTPVKGVIMGEAYIQRDRSDSANRFLCLTGEKGEVLFTFFTER